MFHSSVQLQMHTGNILQVKHTSEGASAAAGLSQQLSSAGHESVDVSTR